MAAGSASTTAIASTDAPAGASSSRGSSAASRTEAPAERNYTAGCTVIAASLTALRPVMIVIANFRKGPYFCQAPIYGDGALQQRALSLVNFDVDEG